MPPNGASFTFFLLTWKRTLGFLERKFLSGRAEKTNRLLLLLFNALVLTLLVIPGQQFMSMSYKAGDIATISVKATQDYLLEDPVLTEKKRAEAETAAPIVYEFNPSVGGDINRRFSDALDEVRRSRGARGLDKEKLSRALADIFEFELTQAEIAALARVKNERLFLNEVSRVVDRIYAVKIVADKRLFAADSIHGINVVSTETGQELGAGNFTSYIEVQDAADLLAGMKLATGGDPADTEIVKGIIAKTLQPNLTFNRDSTAFRKKEAKSAVKPVLFQIKRGEMIVREGERIRDDQALKLKMMSQARSGVNRYCLAAGIFFIILILFYFPYRFARKNIRKFSPTNKDLCFLSYITLGCFIIMKLGLIIATALGSLFPYITTADYYYLFPFAVGGMLVRIVLNSEVALVYCAACAPLIGMMFEYSVPVVVYALLGSIVGAHGVRHCKDRGTIYMAGLKVSVVNAALVFSFLVLSENLFSFQGVYSLVFALAGGLLSAALVTATIPVLEVVFQYTTDIKLLELANLNSPVLRELMVKAPGTYHHSVLVGNLVEAAAEAINANPLLARVAAYYHDVGKLSKPLYFIENCGGHENRHDKLAPSMSALILISHVKEGVELAKEHRLGKPLIDIIRQSHGTALISFFYQKAKGLADPEMQTVDERDFRYPGPKPQTREAGLVMLADCVEAASRTLTDPTPARIQGMVQKIINNIFIDGQLDECELTLKNLHEIAKSFNRILAGIYHHRIDYPEPAFKEKKHEIKKPTIAEVKKPVEDHDREQAAAAAALDERAQKSGGEDIKRLGISR